MQCTVGCVCVFFALCVCVLSVCVCVCPLCSVCVIFCGLQDFDAFDNAVEAEELEIFLKLK